MFSLNMVTASLLLKWYEGYSDIIEDLLRQALRTLKQINKNLPKLYAEGDVEYTTKRLKLLYSEEYLRTLLRKIDINFQDPDEKLPDFSQLIGNLFV